MELSKCLCFILKVHDGSGFRDIRRFFILRTVFLSLSNGMGDFTAVAH